MEIIGYVSYILLFIIVVLIYLIVYYIVKLEFYFDFCENVIF